MRGKDNAPRPSEMVLETVLEIGPREKMDGGPDKLTNKQEEPVKGRGSGTVEGAEGALATLARLG